MAFWFNDASRALVENAEIQELFSIFSFLMKFEAAREIGGTEDAASQSGQAGLSDRMLFQRSEAEDVYDASKIGVAGSESKKPGINARPF